MSQYVGSDFILVHYVQCHLSCAILCEQSWKAGHCGRAARWCLQQEATKEGRPGGSSGQPEDLETSPGKHWNSLSKVISPGNCNPPGSEGESERERERERMKVIKEIWRKGEGYVGNEWRGRRLERLRVLWRWVMFVVRSSDCFLTGVECLVWVLEHLGVTGHRC